MAIPLFKKIGSILYKVVRFGAIYNDAGTRTLAQEFAAIPTTFAGKGLEANTGTGKLDMKVRQGLYFYPVTGALELKLGSTLQFKAEDDTVGFKPIANIAQLAGTEDAPAICTKVNAILTLLKTSGVMIADA